MTTPAHEQRETIRLLVAYPDHQPRTTDPHYAAFQAFERRCRTQGLAKCAVCGTTENVQCHHDLIEFSLQNQVDIQKFDELYGLHLDDESFKTFVESPSNAEWLCVQHHIGAQGVHVLPEPLWQAMRVQKDGPPIVTAFGAAGRPLHGDDGAHSQSQTPADSQDGYQSGHG